MTNENEKPNMYLTTEDKKQIFKEFAGNENDTGSTPGQIALFTRRIEHLTSHLKKHKHDYSTQRALQQLVGKRRRLLNYYKRKDINGYRSLIAKLGIRR